MLQKEELIIEGSRGLPISLDAQFDDTFTKPAPILFVHGFKGFKDWGTFNNIQEFMAKRGCFVMKMNFSHNGVSPTDLANFVNLEAFANNNYIIELEDLRFVVDFLVKSYGELVDLDKLTLVGHSRGGGTAIVYAAADKRIRKLVTWAALSKFGMFWDEAFLANWKKNGVIYIENARTMQQMPLNYQLIETLEQNKERFSIERAAKSLNIPTLVIHGDLDETVNLTCAYTLHNWIKCSKLRIIQACNHVFNGSHPYRPPLLQATLDLIEHTSDFAKD